MPTNEEMIKLARRAVASHHWLWDWSTPTVPGSKPALPDFTKREAVNHLIELVREASGVSDGRRRVQTSKAESVTETEVEVEALVIALESAPPGVGPGYRATRPTASDLAPGHGAA